MTYVMGIDIGINNLAIVLVKVSPDWKIESIEECKLINITDFKHEKVEIIDCKLFHTKTMTDWLEHVFQEECDIFSIAEYILIERQPPQGFVSVEQLIFSKFRQKSILVHPNSVYAWIFPNSTVNTYEERKVKSEEYTTGVFEKCDSLHFYSWILMERKHDIADAICMISYWLNNKHNEWDRDERRKKFDTLTLKTDKGDTQKVNDWFEKYRYTG
jgi:hypothetical protein